MIVLKSQRTQSHSFRWGFCRIRGHLATKPSRHRLNRHQELCIFNTFRKDKSMMTYKPRGSCVTPDFRWRGWSNGGKSKKPKKISRTSNKTQNLWLCSIRRTTRPAGALLWVFRLFWTPPHKIPSQIKPPRKILARFSYPKKSFDHPCHLKSGVPPPTPSRPRGLHTPLFQC